MLPIHLLLHDPDGGLEVGCWMETIEWRPTDAVDNGRGQARWMQMGLDLPEGIGDGRLLKRSCGDGGSLPISAPCSPPAVARQLRLAEEARRDRAR